ncbi:TPA: hypothetical protein EYN09_10700 [Candidatus Poribacteria bacterium]|nr:hypothetical protein [Candidatus Poribacteria bacterium]HIO07370.1 hypothetical protein [Candidatus Poribacteria bacterium]HIO49520.1 hypothetical protein [Candidatus Poribacteria bacterium]
MKPLLLILLSVSLTILSVLIEAQEDSLVLYFSFDEEVEEEIKDLSVHRNHGKVSGKPKWGKGKLGQSLAFDAVDDQVVVPTTESLAIEVAITMMAWVNPGKELLNDW